MQVSRPELEDYCWLVGQGAERYLAEATVHTGSGVALARLLRRELSDNRARLVMDQVELRRRGRVKFGRASEMFFTRQLLEQATDEQIAAYKAQRFPAAEPIADLCCGIGGDLVALAATRSSCVGVDQSPIATLLAAANCERNGVHAETIVADAGSWVPNKQAAWHLDPDRRGVGRRITRLENCQPGPETIDKLSARCAEGAIKLAPATQIPVAWGDAECEWIGSRGECRQQVAWRGGLAKHSGRTATVVDGMGLRGQISGSGEEPIPLVAKPAEYIHEPHAAVLAARLEGAISARHELARFTPLRGYLTSGQRLAEPLLATFLVREVMPLNVKRLSKWFRARQIGQLEIKHRGIPLDLARIRRQLKLKGDEKSVLLVAAQPGASLAIIGERV